MNALRILRALLPSNRRGEDMRRRRAERLERAEAELMGEYVDMTPKMWAALGEGRGLTASTPQAAERRLPPQKRYVRATWFSRN